MSISAYLTFGGNCREAMTFYQHCLGGELVFQTVGDSPVGGQLPALMKQYVLQATLFHPDFVLLGSDMVGEQGLRFGNAVSMMLTCRSEADLRTFHEKLSAGGPQSHSLGRTFWGALFGTLTDRYGNQWLLRFDLPENEPDPTIIRTSMGKV